ncbi:MAG: hypothetical protein Q9166_002725 [cf. Caloplaca sp. 2 TL-2023]
MPESSGYGAGNATPDRAEERSATMGSSSYGKMTIIATEGDPRVPDLDLTNEYDQLLDAQSLSKIKFDQLFTMNALQVKDDFRVSML